MLKKHELKRILWNEFQKFKDKVKEFDDYGEVEIREGKNFISIKFREKEEKQDNTAGIDWDEFEDEMNCEDCKRHQICREGNYEAGCIEEYCCGEHSLAANLESSEEGLSPSEVHARNSNNNGLITDVKPGKEFDRIVGRQLRSLPMVKK